MEERSAAGERWEEVDLRTGVFFQLFLKPVLNNVFYFIVIIILHISKTSQAWLFLKSGAKRGIVASA